MTMGFGTRFVPPPGVPPVVKDGVMSEGSAWGNRDTSAPSAGVSVSAWTNRDTGAPSPGVSTSIWGSETASASVGTSVEVA